MLNVGIDIAKRGHVAAVVDGDGGLVAGPFRFANAADGFSRLLARLEGAGTSPEGMRADFESLPPEARVKLLDMLAESGVEPREWWEKILCGFEVSDAPPEA